MLRSGGRRPEAALRRVGSGATGIVYAAHDPELDRKVAIKILRTLDGEAQHLMREARALANLTHPHVVGVYDVGPSSSARSRTTPTSSRSRS